METVWTNKTRIRINLFLICLGWLVGIVMSLNLWKGERGFPVIPVFDFLNSFPLYVHDLISFLLFISLASQCIFLVIKKKTNQKIILLIIVFAFFIGLLDQSRWQPWVYMYLFLILPYAFMPKVTIKKRYDYVVNIQMIILIAVYIWSGIHKINLNFINELVVTLFVDFLGVENNTADKLKNVGYIIPIMEITVGLGLFYKSSRQKIIYLAISMHILILIFLSPIGVNQNYIVYPWNIVLALIVFSLFFNNNYTINFFNTKNYIARTVGIFIAILFLITPILNFFNKWDAYLSFNLYSQKISKFYIAVSDKEIHKITGDFSESFIKMKNLEGGKIIDVNKWSFIELNVPVYPEERVYKAISKSFCTKNKLNKEVVFLIYEDEKIQSNWNCSNIDMNFN